MGVCLSRAEDAINDFLDQQSRYYQEAKNAKEYATKKSYENEANHSFTNSVLSSNLSPIYPSLPKEAVKSHCQNVYDGDTLTLSDGNRVRLLGIDTPEMKENQPFALEAKEYTKKYCYGKDIWLSYDSNNSDKENCNNKDHYGRLLAFVWVNLRDVRASNAPSQWLCINEGLVASGLAHVYSPTNTKKMHNYDKILGLQKLARTHKSGQWNQYKEEKIIITPNGTAFHKSKEKGVAVSDCKHLAKSKNLSVILKSDAYDRGLHPCRNCLGS